MENAIFAERQRLNEPLQYKNRKTTKRKLQ